MLGRVPHKRGFERDGPDDREIVARALDRVGMAAFANRSFHQLSGGEKQRVLIARAIAQEADHLLLDEPTSHLDVRYQVEVLELVHGLGVTVLAALHELALAALFCDSVHLLADGRLVDHGPPGERDHSRLDRAGLRGGRRRHSAPGLRRPAAPGATPSTQPTRKDHLMSRRLAPRPPAALIAVALASCVLAACGSSSSTTSTKASAGATSSTATTASHYPVTVDNCGTPLTFDSAPTRAVSNDINTTEDMLALGLEHSMVGTFGVTGDGPVNQPVPTQYEAGFKEVRDVSLQLLHARAARRTASGLPVRRLGLRASDRDAAHSAGTGQVRDQDSGAQRVVRACPVGQAVGLD